MKPFQSLILIVTLTSFSLFSCQHKMSDMASSKDQSCCAPTYQAKNKSSELSCKLSTQELMERKMTVLASLKKQMLDRKELSNGYAFRFEGNDKMLDELMEFIKTERTCCDFFVFNLSISGDKSEIWMEMTGVKGAKDFITQELEL